MFGDGGFAGEALMGRSKPNQPLLSYGLDLDVELERRPGPGSEAPKLFVFDGAPAAALFAATQRDSDADEPQQQRTHGVVELAVVDNAKVEGATELGHDHDSGKTYTVLEVAAHRDSRKS